MNDFGQNWHWNRVRKVNYRKVSWMNVECYKPIVLEKSGFSWLYKTIFAALWLRTLCAPYTQAVPRVLKFPSRPHHINPEAQKSLAKFHTTLDFGFWQFYSHICFVLLIAMAGWDLKLLIRNWSRQNRKKTLHNVRLENSVRKWFLKLYTANDWFSRKRSGL